MCDNVIVLWFFFFIKIVAIIGLPIAIILKRKSKVSKILLFIDFFLLIFILLCNIFTINSCIYNSTISGIKRVQKKKQIELYDNIRPNSEYDYTLEDIEPSEYYITSTGSKFYYYNQNSKNIGTKKLSCSSNDYYMNKYGASFTAVSMALSTLADNNITPIDVLNLYTNNIGSCTSGIDIEDIFDIIIDTYAAFDISEISSNDLNNSIASGGIVIAKLDGNSNLSCGESYIVIYNMTLEGKYVIADPDDSDYPFVCSETSSSYGDVLKPNRTNSEWTKDELDSQITKYYLIKRL